MYKARLHSAHNPEREAQRYIDSQHIKDDVEYFILLECGRGFLIPPLRKKNPLAKIISLHINDDYAGIFIEASPPDAEWSPSSPLTCTAFLEEQIPCIESGKIKIIEWRPAFDLDGAAYAKILCAVVDFIKRQDAGKRSGDFFFQIWRRNAQKNIALFAKCSSLARDRLQNEFPAEHKRDIVVCAAGPSLEYHAEKIKAAQKNGAALLAVSSAVLALRSRHILPDIVFASDGGAWARLQLIESSRNIEITCRAPHPPLIAASLQAALLSQFEAFPVLLISSSEDWQNSLFAESGLAFLQLPQRGTVTASAIDFALIISGGNIYLSGADFSCRDINSHARPYALDSILEAENSRFRPFYSQKWDRTRLLNKGGSYKIYERWFKEQKYPSRLKNISSFNTTGS